MWFSVGGLIVVLLVMGWLIWRDVTGRSDNDAYDPDHREGSGGGGGG